MKGTVPKRKRRSNKKKTTQLYSGGARATCREMKRERMRSINKPHGDG